MNSDKNIDNSKLINGFSENIILNIGNCTNKSSYNLSKSQKQPFQAIFDDGKISQSSNSLNFELQAKLKYGLRAQSKIHSEIKDFLELNDCMIFGSEIICSNCKNKIVIPFYCHDKKLCPICNSIYSTRLGMKAFNLFQTFKTNYLVHEVLTLPEDYFSQHLYPDLIKKKLYRMARKFVNIAHGTKVNGVMKVHSWHSKTPFSASHWHVHILISDKTFYEIEQNTLDGKSYPIGYTERNIKVYRTDLKFLRETWQNILGVDQEVNLYHQYSKVNKRKAHWCSYITRDFVYDANKFLLETQWSLNYKLTIDEKKWLKYHTTSKLHAKSLRWFGNFIGKKRAILHRLLFGDFYKMAKTKFVEVCPTCAHKLSDRDDLNSISKLVRIQKSDVFAVILEEKLFLQMQEKLIIMELK